MQPRTPQSLSLLLGALALTSVSAFSDTSPYFLVSSSSAIPGAARSHSILPSSAFLSTASDVIRRCDADAYVLVSQPGLHVEDLKATKHAGAHMKELLGSVDIARSWVAENVFENSQATDMGGVIETLQGIATSVCDALVEGVDAKTGTFKPFDGVKPKVIRVDFDRLPAAGAARTKVVEHNDAFLHTILDMLPTKKFVLAFVSSPIGEEQLAANADVNEDARKAAGLELRSVDSSAEDGAKKNGTAVRGGLFHRYQFFTPAIFMGYIAFFIMILILVVGLRAVSGVAVSYGSFEKEMGPAAAKKQQ